MTFEENLQRLRSLYGAAGGGAVRDPAFRKVAERIFDPKGTRVAPYAGIPTFLAAPLRQIDWRAPDFGDLQVAVIGVPMDLGVTNRNGARFGPRALRTIERIGPYNHVLKCAPAVDLKLADIGDVPFRSRFLLEESHADIERTIRALVEAGVAPLSVGGDHSIALPILKAVGRDRPVGLVHIDAHCDTSGPFDLSKFHHGGPFRHAVLEGALDPRRTIQVGIRGSAEYLWEFSYDSGMTVIHAEEVDALGVEAIVARARAVVGDGPTYLSFDIDSLDPAFAPGTGTPEIGGLTTREALAILRGLQGLNLVGGDVVEVAPQYDATTNTAHAGAQMLFEIASLMVFSPSVGGEDGKLIGRTLSGTIEHQEAPAMLLKITTLLFLLTIGPAGAQAACTQMACMDGLTIDVPPDYSWKPGQYVFEFTLDHKNVRCTGAIPLKSCDEQSLICNAEGVLIAESGCALPPDGHGFGTIMIGGGPASLALSISRGGQTIAQGRWTPAYRTVRPNGPRCEPVCRQATTTLQLK